MNDLKEKITHYTSLGISTLFHPLLLTTYFFSIILYAENFIAYSINPDFRINFILFIFVGTFIFPAFFVFVLKRRGLISSYRIDKQDERTLPFVMGILMYIIIYILLRKISISILYTNFILGTIIIVGLCLFINLYWKISIHAAGMGGISAVFVFLGLKFNLNFFFIIAGIFIISGIVLQARLILKAHSLTQLFIGYLLGFITMTITYIFIK